MAGYSETPLAKKLGIKSGHTVVLVAAPQGFESELEGLPDNVRVLRALRTPVDVVVFFVDRLADLERRFNKIASRLHPAGGFWVAWPKKASRRPTDITEDVVRSIGLAAGLVDNKVCAIDEVWSGLRLVIRVENRDAVAYRAEPPPMLRDVREHAVRRTRRATARAPRVVRIAGAGSALKRARARSQR
jgi:hypothetical protein